MNLVDITPSTRWRDIHVLDGVCSSCGAGDIIRYEAARVHLRLHSPYQLWVCECAHPTHDRVLYHSTGMDWDLNRGGARNPDIPYYTCPECDGHR